MECRHVQVQRSNPCSKEVGVKRTMASRGRSCKHRGGGFTRFGNFPNSLGILKWEWEEGCQGGTYLTPLITSRSGACLVVKEVDYLAIHKASLATIFLIIRLFLMLAVPLPLVTLKTECIVLM